MFKSMVRVAPNAGPKLFALNYLNAADRSPDIDIRVFNIGCAATRKAPRARDYTWRNHRFATCFPRENQASHRRTTGPARAEAGYTDSDSLHVTLGHTPTAWRRLFC